ncbi:hypothetical protein AV926_02560 [Myroides marinus]|uniref:Uncharacterized protein n=2 Tax=Myroides marinus TaxID=703342 RepID=A0A165RQT1_9FLAO|nr:hypothetical protein AV926_02560 [Myroides marinus]
MPVMGLSTVSCSNSDDTTSNYKEAIKTSWVESKIQFLNKDKDTDKVKFAKERGYPEGTVYVQKVYAEK